jgi:alkylation response protein AidB-like acyl-CoA dehydrogenase
MIDTPTTSSTDGALIDELVDRLLGDHDPATTPASEFWGAQFDLGLAWVHFPVGGGGLGASPKLQKVVNERLRHAGAPSPLPRNPMGIGMAGPTVAAHGSDAQRQRYLRSCFTCDDVWCQLFSEPGAGSDLASLATSAVPDGDDWVVNGQKVWTSLAHLARWGLLLARTDPSAPKHRGLTYFVVDMQAPGVEVRPLRQMTGDAEFNEVYLTDVRVPDAERLSEVGDGWRTALTTLMNERVALGGRGGKPRGAGHIATATALWLARSEHDPVRRDRVVRLWVRAEVGRLTAIRAGQLRASGQPGPEGSVGKLAAAQLERDVYDLCVDLLGAAGMLYPGYDRPGGPGEPVDPRVEFLLRQASTIGGGTAEIMRNILGERILGLPPEPAVDKALPWNETRRS